MPASESVVQPGPLSVNQHFVDFCRKFPISTIYDCGSRDARDGMALLDALGASELHVFECNPAAADLCRRNISLHRQPERIHFNEMAVSEREGEVRFFAIDPERTETPWAGGNIGASSLYRANPDYPFERYVQNEITVPSITLDEYCKSHTAPDLLWIDLQGAELRLLQGATSTLDRVRVIHVEVAFKPVYSGQALFEDVHNFLEQRGFVLARLKGTRVLAAFRAARWLLKRRCWVTDAVYVNTALMP